MDRRCLYGHRVNATFHYAIERDQCPICGAELISLDGYRLARQIAQSVPLDGSSAFRTVKLIEASYVLKPRPTAAADGPAVQAPAGTEITLEEEDLSAAAPHGSPSRPLTEEVEDEDSVELIAADATDEQERAQKRPASSPRAATRARTAAPPAVPSPSAVAPAATPVVPAEPAPTAAAPTAAAAPATPTATTPGGPKVPPGAARVGPGQGRGARGDAPFSAEEDAFFASSP